MRRNFWREVNKFGRRKANRWILKGSGIYQVSKKVGVVARIENGKMIWKPEGMKKKKKTSQLLASHILVSYRTKPHNYPHSPPPLPSLPSRELSSSQAGFILLDGFLSLARVRDSFPDREPTHQETMYIGEGEGSPCRKQGECVKYQNTSALFLPLLPEEIIK